MTPLEDMSGPELDAFAAEHVLGWRGEAFYWWDGMTSVVMAQDKWHPDTDWNDAIRVAREAQRHRQMFRDDLIGIDVIRNEPEDLLRQTCIEYAAAEFTHVCWIPDDQA